MSSCTTPRPQQSQVDDIKDDAAEIAVPVFLDVLTSLRRLVSSVLPQDPGQIVLGARFEPKAAMFTWTALFEVKVQFQLHLNFLDFVSPVSTWQIQIAVDAL